MKKQIYFTAGLPRTGSTLLQAILNQNPKIYASGTSGLSSLIALIVQNWENIPEHKAIEVDKTRLLQSVLENYHPTDKSIIFDKSRSWPGQIEILEKIGIEPKMIITLRDFREILASWEMLNRKNPEQLLKIKNATKNGTLADRLMLYTHPESVIGFAFNQIKDALLRGHKDKLLFITYEELTTYPKSALSKIYKFFQLEWFEHDFENLTTAPVENDLIWGYENLHKIKEKLIPPKPKWEKILGEEGEKYYIDWNKFIEENSL